ncbi:MAG: hypothetical protein HLX51_01825 [Micrococcaceae bacterium]|nr:hypothetical protein [Micrococcaceae bacterium]
MAQHVIETESAWEDSHFPRQEDTGVLLGLSMPQTLVAGTGIGIAVLMIVIGGFTWVFPALLIGVPITVVGVVKIHKRSLISWLGAGFKYSLRGAMGQLPFSRTTPKMTLDGDPQQPVLLADEEPPRDKKGRITPGKPARINLPGSHAEMMVYTLPGGAGMVYDPRSHEAMVVAKLDTTKAFSLESASTQEGRITFFSDAMNDLSAIPGVSWWKLSDQTTLISGQHVKEFYRHKQDTASLVERNGQEVRLAGQQIDPFLDAAFDNLMTEAQGMPIHEQTITVALSRSKLAGQISSMGGGIATLMEIALSVMEAVESELPESGTMVSHWHSMRSVAALSRAAFDPDATVGITDRTGTFAGVSPDSAGPMGMQAYTGYLATDNYLHRTYVVSEWPQAKARLGFLKDMVFAGDFRHTVTVVMEPVPMPKAMKKVQGRKADWESSQNIRERWSTGQSLEHVREREDIDMQEEELVDGASPLNMAGLVTVSARTRTELEDNCLQLLTKVAKAQCEVRPLYWEQDAAFIGSAIPFGQVDMKTS